jgi:hypothetical protein
MIAWKLPGQRNLENLLHYPPGAGKLDPSRKVLYKALGTAPHQIRVPHRTPPGTIWRESASSPIGRFAAAVTPLPSY